MLNENVKVDRHPANDMFQMLIILEQVFTFIGRDFVISFINIDRAVVSCMHNPSNTPDTTNCVIKSGFPVR